MSEDTIIIVIAILSFVLGFLVSDKIHDWNEKKREVKKRE